MYFYIARELLPSLILFSVAFASLGLVMLSAFFVWGFALPKERGK
jgi:hypothetical protein